MLLLVRSICLLTCEPFESKIDTLEDYYSASIRNLSKVRMESGYD